MPFAWFAITFSHEERPMLAKILGAIVGERIAGRNRKLTGAMVGAAVPAIAAEASARSP